MYNLKKNNQMTDEKKAAAIKEWETTIKGFFTPGDRGGMINMTYIHPRLDLWNMESVVLHAYDTNKGEIKDEDGNVIQEGVNIARLTFENDDFIYPPDRPGFPGVRGPDGGKGDFNWKAGIITHVDNKSMPAGGPAWSTERNKTFKDWVTKYWPPFEPKVLA
jgi:hypothetical protein